MSIQNNKSGKLVTTARILERQAATNPLSNCPGQLKILLGNQKIKMLCLNRQLKCKQGNECEPKLCDYFWHFNRCAWHFISKQVEGDSFNLMYSRFFPETGVLRFCKQQHQVLGSKVRYDWAIDLVSGCPLGLPGENILLPPVKRGITVVQAWFLLLFCKFTSKQWRKVWRSIESWSHIHITIISFYFKNTNSIITNLLVRLIAGITLD